MSRLKLLLVAVLLVSPRAAVCVEFEDEASVNEEKIEFFEKRIRPVLIEHCYECHSSASQSPDGGLRLDWRQGWSEGGDSGPAIVPSEPESSLLMEAVRHQSLEMPPTHRLPDEIIADLHQWISDGAVDPRVAAPTTVEAAEMSWKRKLAERKQWWSLQAPKAYPTPPRASHDTATDPLDHFILDKLNDAGLSMAPPASGEVLFRRLSFVLTGLPPDSQRYTDFQRTFAANPDQAVEQWVDFLLATPHYGERFARHWMDVIRYTDTYGYEWDNPAKGSWEFRDYLVRAFNADIGFDQMIREQVAGDLLPEPRSDLVTGINESLIGPMFFHFGEHRHGTSLDFNGIHQEMIDNKIDAFSKAFLGMTVACARCHDHKLDAISQADYYRLAGMLMTARWTPRDISISGHQAELLQQLEIIQNEIHRQIAGLWSETVHRSDWNGDALRRWALENREALSSLPMEHSGHPLGQLLEALDPLESSNELSDSKATEKGFDEEYPAAPASGGIGIAWLKMAENWSELREERQAFNAENFSVLTDFEQPGFPDGWVTDGHGMDWGHTQAGQLLVSLEGPDYVDSILEQGYHSHRLSSKLAGALRLPAPESFPSRYVSLLMSGGGWAGRITVPQNAFQAEEIFFFDPAAPAAWQTIGPSTHENGVTRVLTEYATPGLHSNFPPRTGLARSGSQTLPDDDDGMSKRSWISLTGIVAHEDPQAPADPLDCFVALYSASEPEDEADAWQNISVWLAGAVNRWIAGKMLAGDAKVLNWLLASELLPNRRGHCATVDKLIDNYRLIESNLEYPRSAMSMDERDVAPVDYRLNLRGDVDQDGPAIERGFLEVFPNWRSQSELSTTEGWNRTRSSTQVGSPESSESDLSLLDNRPSSLSGRLELAEYLSGPETPQAARVYVNRVWHWIFGSGLVSTTSDFGRLGEAASHPELLDWLSIQFINEGWSTKQLVRRLVLSRTFGQSGDVSENGRVIDPQNRLWHHYPTRRLEAESIRDSLLAVTGHLDRQLTGPPINAARNAEDPAKRLFSGPWDGNGRRSLYLTMSIMEPPKFLTTFNLPDLKLPTGRRDQTNVPNQALVLLNDPFVQRLAEHWARQLLTDGNSRPEDRLQCMFESAVGRPPSRLELRRWSEAFAQFSEISGDAMTDVECWTEIAHAMMNLKEFIYYR